MADTDDDDDLDDPNEVYAVSTVISLSERQKESVAGIRSVDASSLVISGHDVLILSFS